jgi:hypothetical protein
MCSAIWCCIASEHIVASRVFRILYFRIWLLRLGGLVSCAHEKFFANLHIKIFLVKQKTKFWALAGLAFCYYIVVRPKIANKLAADYKPETNALVVVKSGVGAKELLNYLITHAQACVRNFDTQKLVVKVCNDYIYTSLARILNWITHEIIEYLLEA